MAQPQQQQVSMTTIKMGGTPPADEESVRVLKAQAAQRREEYERQVAEAQRQLLQEQQLRRQVKNIFYQFILS